MVKRGTRIQAAGLYLAAAAVLICGSACSGRGGGGIGAGGQNVTLEAASIPSISDARDVTAVLSELDALQPPDGVDGVTFSLLKTAVGDTLRQRAEARVVSAAPQATLGQVEELLPFDAGSYAISFSWNECNPGDYDLNGETNLPDLAVLARNFGMRSGSPGWARARVADGNADGMLDAQDAVAIAENLLNRISGYAVYRSLPGGSSPDLLGRVTRDAAVILAGVVVQFHFEDGTVDSPGQLYTYEVRPYANPDGTGEGIASRTFTLRAGASYGVPPTHEVATVVDAQQLTRRIVAGEALLTFNHAPTREQVLFAVYEQAGGELLGQIPGSLTFRMRLPNDASRTVAAAVERAKSASGSSGYSIEPNYLVPGPAPVEYVKGSAAAKSSSMTYADPLRGQLWGLDAVHADQAWDTAQGAGVIVAVIDSGVETSHEDLEGQTVEGARFGGSDAWNDDTSGHGTHVAGTIAALAGNSKGVVGLSPKVKVMPLRCGANYGGNWSFPVSDLCSAMNYAVQHGAKVVNMSLGGRGTLGSAFEAALANAESNGVVVLAAAGNDNVSAQGYYPATYPTVVSVGAVGPALARAPFSNYGYPDYVDLCAPGGDGTYAGAILSTVPASPSAYERLQGTSMACPHAAAVAGLILSADPGLSAEEVRRVLHDTASTIGASTQVGPLINAQAALESLAAGGASGVFGSVLRGDGTGIPGVNIALSGAASRSAVTDASGNFAIANLPDGTYTLTPSKSAYAFTPASQVVSVSGSAASGQDFTGVQGASVEAEHNDSSAQANVLPDLPFGAAQFSGSLGSGSGYSANDGDAVDYLRFTLASPQRVSFSMSFNSTTGNLDLRLMGSNGSTVLQTSATATAPETVSAYLADAGTYYLKCTRASGYSDYSIAGTAAPAYTISGTVVNKTDAKGLAGATMTLAGNGLNLTAKTSATGAYSIAGVPDGSYTLTPSLAGRSFSPASMSFTISGASAAGKDFQASGSFAVSGAVYQKNGAALPGATLKLTGDGWTKSIVSGSDGKFALAGVPDGSYSLSCSAKGRSFSPASTAVSVAGADVAGCYFLAEGPFSVAGTIAAGNGSGLSGVTLKLAGNGLAISTTANSLGKFMVNGVPNGVYTLTPASRGRTFAPASRTVTVQGANVTGINFTGAGPFTVTGHVTDLAGGTGVASVKIILRGEGLSLSGITSASGDYTIANVPNGNYTLSAARTGRIFTPATSSVNVSGSNVTGQDFSSYRVFSISGKVTFNGAALAGVALNLSGDGGTFAVQTGTTGTYSLAGVPAGTYTLTPSMPGRSFTPAATTITVMSANIASQNFTAR